MNERVGRVHIEARVKDVCEARKRAGAPGARNLAQLCQVIGVSRSTWRSAFHGTGSPYGPGRVSVANIAHALGVSIDVVECRESIPDFARDPTSVSVGESRVEVLRAHGAGVKGTVVVESSARFALVDYVTGVVRYYADDPAAPR